MGIETIVVLRELNADEQVRREAFYREKRLHDEATALGNARREGVIETLASLVKDGIITIADAAQRANMSISEFESKIG